MAIFDPVSCVTGLKRRSGSGSDSPTERPPQEDPRSAPAAAVQSDAAMEALADSEDSVLNRGRPQALVHPQTLCSRRGQASPSRATLSSTSVKDGTSIPSCLTHQPSMQTHPRTAIDMVPQRNQSNCGRVWQRARFRCVATRPRLNHASSR